MTAQERIDLVRAQREVAWNLQQDGIVTVMQPGDEPVPYKRQGNPAVNTPQSVRRRQSLRKKPLIQVKLALQQPLIRSQSDKRKGAICGGDQAYSRKPDSSS